MHFVLFFVRISVDAFSIYHTRRLASTMFNAKSSLKVCSIQNINIRLGLRRFCFCVVVPSGNFFGFNSSSAMHSPFTRQTDINNDSWVWRTTTTMTATMTDVAAAKLTRKYYKTVDWWPDIEQWHSEICIWNKTKNEKLNYWKIQNIRGDEKFGIGWNDNIGSASRFWSWFPQICNLKSAQSFQEQQTCSQFNCSQIIASESCFLHCSALLGRTRTRRAPHNAQTKFQVSILVT